MKNSSRCQPATNQNMTIKSAVIGYWVEDQSQRDNMNAFLKEFEIDVFGSDYALNVFFLSTQFTHISIEKLGISILVWEQ